MQVISSLIRFGSRGQTSIIALQFRITRRVKFYWDRNVYSSSLALFLKQKDTYNCCEVDSMPEVTPLFLLISILFLEGWYEIVQLLSWYLSLFVPLGRRLVGPAWLIDDGRILKAFWVDTGSLNKSGPKRIRSLDTCARYSSTINNQNSPRSWDAVAGSKHSCIHSMHSLLSVHPFTLRNIWSPGPISSVY